MFSVDTPNACRLRQQTSELEKFTLCGLLFANFVILSFFFMLWYCWYLEGHVVF